MILTQRRRVSLGGVLCTLSTLAGGCAMPSNVASIPAVDNGPVSPNRVVVGTPTTLRITLPDLPPKVDDLKVSIDREQLTGLRKDSDGKTLLADWTKPDAAGSRVLTVKDSQEKVLLAAVVTVYAPDATHQAGYATLWIYASIIVLVGLVPLLIDIRKAYSFASETRKLLIEKMKDPSPDQLRLILSDLSDAPPGIPGLARSMIAIVIITIIGLAVFHLIVLCPECAQGKDTADKILTLLTGALTAITGFYFGGKAVQEGHKSATAQASDLATQKVNALRNGDAAPH